MQCRFLVTSRRKAPAEQCRILYRRALFHNHTLTDDSPDNALDEILRLADYHTLAVELLAKTQRAKRLNVAELLTQLQGTGFDLNGEDIEYLHHPEEAPENADTESTFVEHMSHILTCRNCGTFAKAWRRCEFYRECRCCRRIRQYLLRR